MERMQGGGFAAFGAGKVMRRWGELRGLAIEEEVSEEMDIIGEALRRAYGLENVDVEIE